MEEPIISFKVAKLANEKGFDESTPMGMHTYTEDEWLGWEMAVPLSKDGQVLYKAPTQSFLQKWLRDEHGLYLLIKRGYGWEWYVEGENKGDGTYYSYEDALEDGLYETLKMVE